jgi:hypothetical protein
MLFLNRKRRLFTFTPDLLHLSYFGAYIYSALRLRFQDFKAKSLSSSDIWMTQFTSSLQGYRKARVSYCLYTLAIDLLDFQSHNPSESSPCIVKRWFYLEYVTVISKSSALCPCHELWLSSTPANSHLNAIWITLCCRWSFLVFYDCWAL